MDSRFQRAGRWQSERTALPGYAAPIENVVSEPPQSRERRNRRRVLSEDFRFRLRPSRPPDPLRGRTAHHSKERCPNQHASSSRPLPPNNTSTGLRIATTLTTPAHVATTSTSETSDSSL